MKGCMSHQEKVLAKNLQEYKDSAAASQKKVAAISVSYDSLKKSADALHITIVKNDSAFKFKIDSISFRYVKLQKQYYADTSGIKRIFQRLQIAFNARDTTHLQEIMDSLVIEARSANWTAQNLFYDCGQRDSIWRSQKAFDDSVIEGYRIIDSGKDVRFNSLLAEYNSLQELSLKQQEDLAKYAILLKKAQSANLKWGIIGLVLGIGTNYLHK
jgi:hypothetical protein